MGYLYDVVVKISCIAMKLQARGIAEMTAMIMELVQYYKESLNKRNDPK